MTDKPRRLGRGLEALIGGPMNPPVAAPQPSQATAAPAALTDGSSYRRISIAQIRPNPHQPRKEFKPEELAELEASMRTSGLLQPITVRQAANGNGYELVAGERRLRAATRLGWTEIPAVVKEVDDQSLLTLALIENLQRADLNPVEEADGYHRLTEEFGLTQHQVAELVGKDRSTIANFLRILSLPTTVRAMLQRGELTLGHARAILALEHESAMVDLARQVVAEQLTVRDVERRAREQTTKPKKIRQSTERSQANDAPEVRRITADLRRYLQTDVQLVLSGSERGEIRLQFFSADDLERLMELIIKSPRDQ